MGERERERQEVTESMSYGHLEVELGLDREGGEAISQNLLQLSRCGHPPL